MASVGALACTTYDFSSPANEFHAGLVSGEQHLLVLILSSQCAAARSHSFQRDWTNLKSALTREAAALAQELVVVGVSLDRDIDKGLGTLAPFGPFDEITVGSGWLNLTAERFFWTDVPGVPTIPQVLLLARSVSVSAGGVELSRPELLARLLGEREVENWLARFASDAAGKH